MGPTDSLNAVRKWNSISSTKKPKSSWMFSGAFSIFSSSGTSPVPFHPFQDKPREKLSYVVSRLVLGDNAHGSVRFMSDIFFI